MREFFTRHQVPRGTLADLETDDRIYLIKNVSILHATYQVRLLLFKAQRDRKKLVLKLPKAGRLGPTLSALRREHPGHIVIERL